MFRLATRSCSSGLKGQDGPPSTEKQLQEKMENLFGSSEKPPTDKELEERMANLVGSSEKKSTSKKTQVPLKEMDSVENLLSQLAAENALEGKQTNDQDPDGVENTIAAVTSTSTASNELKDTKVSASEIDSLMKSIQTGALDEVLADYSTEDDAEDEAKVDEIIAQAMDYAKLDL